MAKVMLNQKRVDDIVEDATEAWNRGDEFFTPLVGYTPRATAEHGAIPDWPAVLSGVIATGWSLHTWAVSTIDGNRPIALPLFERP